MKRFCFLFLLLAGCTPVGEKTRQDAVSLREERGCVVTVLVDLSSSFEEEFLGPERESWGRYYRSRGKAYDFLLNVLDTYFRDRIGENDELVIGMISGDQRSLLWQGTPMQLRKDFATPEDLENFFDNKKQSDGSNVFNNIAESLEYAASDPDVKSGAAKSAVLVLSDMEDNSPDQDASRERLKKALGEYSRNGGVVGCYYVRQDLVASCREFMAEAGVQKFIVEGDIVGNPYLPLIE